MGEFRLHEEHKQNISHFGWKLAVLIILLLTLAGLISYLYVEKQYAVTQIEVTGNIHYTKEAMVEMIMTDPMYYNTLYLKYLSPDLEIEIPFVQEVEVTVQGHNTVRITVYEKALAGYVKYLGKYMYFDKDGIVVESSSVATQGIPLVSGLSFSHIVLYEPLPVAKADIFQVVLDVTQTMQKYELIADKILFTGNYSIQLSYGEIDVFLGDSLNLDQKIAKAKEILPELEGEQGTLQLQNVGDNDKNITFVTE